MLDRWTLYQVAADVDVRPHIDDGAGSGFVINRRNGRGSPMFVSDDCLLVLERFQTPTTIADAVVEIARSEGIAPEPLLSDVFPLLQRLVDRGVLVHEADVDEAFRWAPAVGKSIDGWTLTRRVRVLEDSACFHCHRDGQDGFIKVVNATTKFGRAVLQNERTVLDQLDGLRTPSVLDLDLDAELPYLVLTRVGGVCLAGLRTSPWPFEKRMTVIRSLLDAYRLLHDREVLHVDVHAGNVMVDGDGVTLVDFGASRWAHAIPAIPGRAVVPTNYEPEAAEAYLDGRPVPSPSPEGEQYAVAALCYEILTGQGYLDLPSDRNAMFKAIAEDPPRPFRTAHVVADEIEAVLGRALRKSPAERYPDLEALGTAIDEAGRQQADVDHVAHWLGQMDDADYPIQSSPTASLNFGAAGTAFCLLQIAGHTGDGEHLARADRWLQRAYRELARGEVALLDPANGLHAGLVSRHSLLHGPQGVEVARWFRDTLWGDNEHGRDPLSMVELPEPEAFDSDMFLGDLGLFVVVSAMNTERQRNDINRWTDRVAGGLVESARQRYGGGRTGDFGFGHGLGGVLFALALHIESGGAHDRASVEDLVSRFAAGAVVHQGRPRWPWGRTDEGQPFFMSGLCSGDAGHVLVWSALSRLGLHPDAEHYRDACAERLLHAPWTAGHVCCGSAGGAIALLHLHAATGQAHRLEGAKTLAARAFELAFDGPETSLFKGRAGAVLANVMVESETPLAFLVP